MDFMHECRVLESLMDVIRLTQRNPYNYNLIYIVGIIECTVRGVHVTGTAAAPAASFL